MTSPRVPQAAIIIPCFNHGRFVADAVRSCLAQVDAEVRVVIVDDGSTDGFTPPACDACRALGSNIEVVHQRNVGLPGARNAGAARISRQGWGEYLVFLDADDWIQPNFVSRLAEALRAARDAGPDGAAVSHAYCQERLVERAAGVWEVPDWDPAMLLVTNLHPVTALVRRECYEQVGGFDVTMTGGYEDWDLWMKFAEQGWRGVRVREPLFVWRRHAEVTMIVQAGAKHDALYDMLIARHPKLLEKHAANGLRHASSLLRKAEGAWLDEHGEPIVLRDLRAWARDLVRERDGASERLKELELAQAHALATLEARIRSEYERKPSIRLSRGLFGLRDRLLRRK